MKNSRKNRLYLFGFLLTSPLLFSSVIMVLGIIQAVRSGESYEFLILALVFLICFVIFSIPSVIAWFCFLRKLEVTKDGIKAGMLSIFLCLLFIGIAVGITRFGTRSMFHLQEVIVIIVLAQLIFGVVAYPIGIFAGWFFSKKTLSNRPNPLDSFN